MFITFTTVKKSYQIRLDWIH